MSSVSGEGAAAAPSPNVFGDTGHLQRTVGLRGLTLVSLGSIIGSGWLLGALNAATAAGPASLLSWILAGSILATAQSCFAWQGRWRWLIFFSNLKTNTPAMAAEPAAQTAAYRFGPPAIRRMKPRVYQSHPSPMRVAAIIQ